MSSLADIDGQVLSSVWAGGSGMGSSDSIDRIEKVDVRRSMYQNLKSILDLQESSCALSTTDSPSQSNGVKRCDHQYGKQHRSRMI